MHLLISLFWINLHIHITPAIAKLINWSNLNNDLSNCLYSIILPNTSSSHMYNTRLIIGQNLIFFEQSISIEFIILARYLRYTIDTKKSLVGWLKVTITVKYKVSNLSMGNFWPVCNYFFTFLRQCWCQPISFSWLIACLARQNNHQIIVAEAGSIQWQSNWSSPWSWIVKTKFKKMIRLRWDYSTDTVPTLRETTTNLTQFG